ncbi:hypothetical protein [Streptomyces sp. NRRL S-920]|uniref:hypothetical protein n=1 Tax=Streptomyces sp. NRRL S-920 TaxID=1463921 RepID=UPI002D21E412|nr:hypothetical protein [Streptomyces sp. NRRL S-920]
MAAHPVQTAQGGQAQGQQAYVIRNAVSGKVLGNPAAADRAVRQRDAAGRNLRAPDGIAVRRR